NVRDAQILAVVPTEADYSEYRNGFGTGFIDKCHLETVQGKQRVEDSLGDLNNPLSNHNLLTWKDTQIYDSPSVRREPFG
ncbi:polysaccharide deacetylase family protein, partial [Klebsiella quasipneumoniae]|nr:polysaccharide deacetylase family protein [Klebsiella quasipneumoniae]